MIRLIHTWWNFSQCWGGVGATLFWWTAVTVLLFAAAVPCFARNRLPGTRTFLLCLISGIAVHFFVLLLTWSGVWGTLYMTSYHWKPGEREENAFLMWQATFGLGVISSCLLAGAALLLKPEKTANQPSQPIAGKPGSG